MKHSSLVFTLLGVLLLALGIVWYLQDNSQPTDGIESSAQTSASEAGGGTPAAAQPVGNDDGSAKALGERTEIAATQASRIPEQSFDVETGIWIEGQVALDAGCPATDDLEVYALREYLNFEDFAEIYREAEHDEDDLERIKGNLVSRRTVAQDGSFRIPVPGDLDVVYLMLKGRYHYIPKAEELDLEGRRIPVTLEPRTGAWVTGHLEAPEGMEDQAQAQGLLANNNLELEFDSSKIDPNDFDDSEAVDMEIRSDEQGRFEFRAVPATQSFFIDLFPEDFAASRTPLTGLTPCQENPIAIRLKHGGKVHGLVTDAEGEPVAGAEVEAFFRGAWFGFDDKAVRSSESDENGIFELKAVAAGSVWVKASHKGYLESTKISVEVPERGSIDKVTLELEGGQSITGRLTWPGGEPVADVEIRASFDPAFRAGPTSFNALRGASGEANADSEGSFRITGLGAGPFVISASAPPREASQGFPESAEDQGSDRETWHNARMSNVAPGSEIDLVLHPPMGIRGRVVDENGEPVSEFQVKSVRLAEGFFGPVGMENLSHSFNDEEGEFFLPGMSQGSWVLAANADGYSSTEEIKLQLPLDTESSPIVIALMPTSTVSGIVLDPDDRIVAEAEIKVDTGLPEWQDAMMGEAGAPTTKSDEFGRFKLEGLAPGKIALFADTKDHAAGPPVPFELVGGEEIEDAELRVIEGGTLTGEAYEDDGAPATGMAIVLMTTNMDQLLSSTDDEGKFRFENVEPGTWQVIAMDRDADFSNSGDGNLSNMLESMKMSQAKIADGETTHIVIGAPPANPVKIHGKITQAGNPFRANMISFYPEGGRLYETLKFTSVDEQGEYELVVDGPGTYVAGIQIAGELGAQQHSIEYSHEIPAEPEHRIDIALPLGRISGHVIGPDGGPAAGTRITLTPEGGFRSDVLRGGLYAELETNPQGEYDLNALRPGNYTLSAGGSFFFSAGESSTLGRQTLGGILLEEGEWKQNVDFRLEEPGSIGIEVVGPDGEPVQEAWVFMRNEEGRIVEPFSLAGTDGAGLCDYGGLSPGAYTVTARKGLLVSEESRPIRVHAGEKARLQLRLQEGTILWIVLKEKGADPVSANVRVVDSEGREWGGMFGMDDFEILYLEGGFSPTEVRLGPLPPGKYRIFAEGEGELSGSKTVTLKGRAERKVTLRLRK